LIVIGIALAFGLTNSGEKEIDPEIIQLKQEHCNTDWTKIDKRTKEKLLNEYIEHDVYLTDGNALASPFSLSERLLKEAVKYPSTIKKDGLPTGKIEDIEKG